MTDTELLARIDERVEDIQSNIKDVKEHLEKLNNQVVKNKVTAEMANLKAENASLQTEKLDSKFFNLLVGVIVTVIPLLVALITKSVGLW